MFEKTKNFATKMEKKVEKALAPVVTAAAAMGLTPDVYATTTVAGGNNAATDAIQQIVNVVFKIFQYIGVVLALWGAGSLIMAFKNEDADSKTRAIMSLVVGICLVALRALFGDLVADLLATDPSTGL